MNAQKVPRVNKPISDLNNLVMILVNRIKTSERHLSSAERLLRDMRTTCNDPFREAQINKYFEVKNKSYD